MLDWKQRVKDKCAERGIDCIPTEDGFLVKGTLLALTGIDELTEKYQEELNDLVDYRLAAILRPEDSLYSLMMERK